MTDKLIFNCTHGKEDPERAILPFVAANIAAVAGQDAVVLCTIEAVWLGTRGGTDGVLYTGLPDLAGLYEEFVQNGGQVWLCGACTKPRGITEEQVAGGAAIVGAAKVVEEVMAGAKTVAFAG
jgi:predicted peroxiredoxin